MILARGAQALGEDGVVRPLARRDTVLVGDTLSTASTGMLQVRFVDKALLTLRENSHFRIETYAPPTDGGGNVLMHLVEGGFRTITGSIGKGSQDSYKVTTGAASIGIRGTHYEVVQESANAIVVAVWDGGIRLSNDNGGLDLGPDGDFSYSRVETGQAPTGLLEPPAVFQQGPAATQNTPPPSSEAAAQAGSDSDSGSTTEQTSSSSAIALAPPTSLSSLNAATPSASPTPTTETLDFSVTNTQLQDAAKSIAEIEEIEETVPVSDPWTTKSTVDPRLYVAEFEQLIDPSRNRAVIVMQNPEISLATLISPKPPALYDFAANGPVNFELKYFINDGSTSTSATIVNILLDKHHTSLNTLVSDIQEHLTAAGALVGVRESAQNPGRLEFYTADPSASHLHFELRSFDVSASSAQVLDVTNALGGLVDGAFASGFREGYPMRAAVVFGLDGKPSAFLAPNRDASMSPASMPSLASLGVGRQGDAQLTDYVAAVGGRSNITWGRWDASADNPIHIYEDINAPNTVTEFEDHSGYWLTAETASTTSLSGTQTFQMGAVPLFMGSGSDGAVQAMSGAFAVDFTTGAISGGALSLTTA
ncbi:MAG TPA: FecR family protein, partial [Pseudomonas sp.]|nr:FecR family protein [Pseudomonas sp.]